MPVFPGAPGVPMNPAFKMPPFTLAPPVTLTAGSTAPSGFVSVVKVPAPEATPGVSVMPLLLVSVTLSGPVLPCVSVQRPIRSRPHSR